MRRRPLANYRREISETRTRLEVRAAAENLLAALVLEDGDLDPSSLPTREAWAIFHAEFHESHAQLFARSWRAARDFLRGA